MHKNLVPSNRTIWVFAGSICLISGIWFIWVIRACFFIRFAGMGWSDSESPNFKALNDHFGVSPGNPGCMDCHEWNRLGIWVTIPIEPKGETCYVALEKNTWTREETMKVNFFGKCQIAVIVTGEAIRRIATGGIPADLKDKIMRANTIGTNCQLQYN